MPNICFIFMRIVNILGDQEFLIKTSRGIISRSSLKRMSPDGIDMLPTDTGIFHIFITFKYNNKFKKFLFSLPGH